MTPIEQIIIRWIAAINAGVTAVSAGIVAVEGLDQTVVLIIMLVAAFLSAVTAFFTTEQGRATARSMSNGTPNT